jgi:hypothetical protein
MLSEEEKNCLCFVRDTTMGEMAKNVVFMFQQIDQCRVVNVNIYASMKQRMICLLIH